MNSSDNHPLTTGPSPDDSGAVFLTVKEVAVWLKISVRSVYRLAEDHPEWVQHFRGCLRFNKTRMETDF
jgi:hypothetical protein